MKKGKETNTLGIDLKVWKMQGIEFKQQNITFEYRLRIKAKKLWSVWNIFYRSYCEEVLKEILKDDFVRALKVVSLDDLVILMSKDGDPSYDIGKSNQITGRLNKMVEDDPLAFEALDKGIAYLIKDAENAMDLFVAERDNLKNLFAVMLSGSFEKIEFESNDPKWNDELDKVGVEVLRDFFTLKSKRLF